MKNAKQRLRKADVLETLRAIASRDRAIRPWGFVGNVEGTRKTGFGWAIPVWSSSGDKTARDLIQSLDLLQQQLESRLGEDAVVFLDPGSMN